MFIRLLIIIFASLSVTVPVYARFDPKSVPNNKYGFHIADTNDLREAAKLVNSNGGEWGYVTVVIPSSDRNKDKWQNIFNEMRRLKVIPLVRLAGRSVDDFWTVPEENDIRDWVNFLHSLNWPVENRYVILFNEPNHGKEWGNQADPESYADVFVKLTEALKTASEDFFVLPAAMDVSAEGGMLSMDAETYITRMIRNKPEILELIDGINSHSYPNPGFSGRPTDSGRGTLRSYVWEKQLLVQLGLKRDLPVFITETGWQHSDGKRSDRSLLDPQTVSGYISQAASGVWSDPEIVAVTPFVFSYQDYPFDHFSWKKLGSDGYYPMYDAYSSIQKTKGVPKQREKYRFTTQLFPEKLVAGSHYTLGSELENDGQNIVNREQGYELVITGDERFEYTVSPLSYIEPGQRKFTAMSLTTPDKPGTYTLKASVKHGDTSVQVEEREVIVVPPPSISIGFTLGWRTSGRVKDVTVLIYDLNDRLIHKYAHLNTTDGKLTVTGLTDIIPGETYRIVALIPYYLPRQHYVIMTEKETQITMPRYIPVDIDKNGALTVADLLSAIRTNPIFLFRLAFGP